MCYGGGRKQHQSFLKWEFDVRPQWKLCEQVQKTVVFFIICQA